jgi:hypothetical protein
MIGIFKHIGLPSACKRTNVIHLLEDEKPNKIQLRDEPAFPFQTHPTTIKAVRENAHAILVNRRFKYTGEKGTIAIDSLDVNPKRGIDTCIGQKICVGRKQSARYLTVLCCTPVVQCLKNEYPKHDFQ